MLEQFNWQQFLVAALVFTLIWYLSVILIFYRKELNAFLERKQWQSKPKEPLAHSWEKDVEVLEEENENVPEELMGKSKMPDGLSNVSMGKIGFVPNDDDKALQIGLVPDVLQELKEVFAILAKEDGNKKDFFNLMEMVREKYPQIGSNSNIGRINEFIAEHASFHISKEELENLWD